jgi:hypothetical protein
MVSTQKIAEPQTIKPKSQGPVATMDTGLPVSRSVAALPVVAATTPIKMAEGPGVWWAIAFWTPMVLNNPRAMVSMAATTSGLSVTGRAVRPPIMAATAIAGT